MENNDLTNGLFAFRPEGPDFVKARLSIEPKTFIEYLRANADKRNDSGYFAIDVLESKSGKWYCKINSWKKDTVDGEDKQDF